MLNFRIGTQIEKEIEDFRNTQIKLAAVHKESSTIRYGKTDVSEYYFNQADTIAAIDFARNSQFENGLRDKNNQRKIFMNVGNFRCDVSSKQIDIDVKDGRFTPTQFAPPWIAIFLQREFLEWAKEQM